MTNRASAALAPLYLFETRDAGTEDPVEPALVSVVQPSDTGDFLLTTEDRDESVEDEFAFADEEYDSDTLDAVFADYGSLPGTNFFHNHSPLTPPPAAGR